MNAGFRSPCWQSRAQSKNAVHLQITEGLSVEYTGPGLADQDAASVRTNIAVPPDCGLFYFEVKIVSRGRDGYIGVGFCVADNAADRLPGWEVGSWGYHGDDGNAFGGTGKGFPYGPCFTTGDVVGALWNRIAGQISFFKNGICLGVAFEDIRNEKLYPTVGLRTKGEQVTANFGSQPWRTDVKTFQREVQRQVDEEIAAVQLQKPRKPVMLLEELIFSHLQHDGYADTARTAALAMFGSKRHVSAEDAAAVQQRHHVSSMVSSGNIPAALAAAEEVAPGILSAKPALLFRLHVQAFIEHVRNGRDAEALEYGRNTLVHCASTDADHALLQDASTLLGYADPASSPVGQLLSEQHKAVLAEDVNRAILGHQGCQEKSTLERVLRQGVVVAQELKKSQHPVASMLEMPMRRQQ